jgi:beta-glucanase (GH16 family)
MYYLKNCLLPNISILIRIILIAVCTGLLFTNLAKSQTRDIDFPPNSLTKLGWNLTQNDEFTDSVLRDDLWIPYYFRHRASDEKTKSNYRIVDGHLILTIDSSGNRFSAVQTLERPNLHKPGKRFDIPTSIKFSQKYGYFELRAKTQGGSGHNSAFWLIGVQEDSTQSAEIDIFEQPSKLGDSSILFNLHEWKDNDLAVTKRLNKQNTAWNNRIKLGKNLTSTFNIYGLEWDDKTLKLYFNNRLVSSINASPNYPMGIILSLYEGNNWWGKLDKSVKYPKEFIIDYIRIYSRTKN